MTISQSVASNGDPIQHLMFQIIQRLVDDEQAVRVDCMEEEGVITLQVRVAPWDTSKLIGKQGRTARSLRTVLSAASKKLHSRYALNIEKVDEIQEE